MVDIPLDARTECADGPCGHSVGAVIGLLGWRITHLVIETGGISRRERLVSASWVVRTTPDVVCLRCKGSELEGMQPFVELEYAPLKQSTIVGGTDCTWYHGWPYLFPSRTLLPVKREHVPVGETVVRRGARVIATDGPVGRADEFLADSMTRGITHLVLRQGHLWSQRDVMIPISAVRSVGEHEILLKLDRPAVGMLPTLPAKEWHQHKAA